MNNGVNNGTYNQIIVSVPGNYTCYGILGTRGSNKTIHIQQKRKLKITNINYMGGTNIWEIFPLVGEIGASYLRVWTIIFLRRIGFRRVYNF